MFCGLSFNDYVSYNSIKEMGYSMETSHPIYVVGHKSPDTDSIVAAISYAQLKNELGFEALACRLGELNHETEFILKRFGFKKPHLLDDARMRIEEIDIDAPINITEETTIYEAWQLFQEHKKALCVVDDQQQLIGLLSSSDIAKVAMGDTAKSIELLAKTPIEYIASTIKGKLIYAPEKTRLNGKVSIVAVAEQKLNNYELEDRLVIVGNDREAQLQAIEKNAACLVVVWAESVQPLVIEVAKAHGCAIILSGHGTLNTSRYIFYSSPIKYIMKTELIQFDKSEFVEDALNRLMKSRYRSYPVVDDHGKVYGLISRYHLLNARRKKIILVDHNEVSQSVDAVLEADLMEVVDHHRIGDIQTNRPINFRNQSVGSTNTIIANLYFENRLEPDAKIAGLMASAIISDTLNFKSPTTTSIDVDTANYLAHIANIDLDDLAKEIFTIGSGLQTKSPLEIIENDIKEFAIGKYRVKVGQISLYELDQVEEVRPLLEEVMKEYVKEKKIDVLMLLFTSLERQGSAILSAGPENWIVQEAFPAANQSPLALVDELMSRKKQVIPRLSYVVDHNG